MVLSELYSSDLFFTLEAATKSKTRIRKHIMPSIKQPRYLSVLFDAIAISVRYSFDPGVCNIIDPLEVW